MVNTPPYITQTIKGYTEKDFFSLFKKVYEIGFFLISRVNLLSGRPGHAETVLFELRRSAVIFLFFFLTGFKIIFLAILDFTAPLSK